MNVSKVNKKVSLQHVTWEIIHMASVWANESYNDKSSGMHVNTHTIS